MNIFQAIILGIIQGLTEFLPVSSSGHLVLFQNILGVSGDMLFFDTMLHVGTLVAIFIVMKDEIIKVFKNLFGRYTWLLAAATVPAVVATLLFGDFFEEAFEGRYLGLGFILTSILLITCEIVSSRGKAKRHTEKDITWPAAIGIGCMQAVAILPGVSRSGSTISGGLFAKFDRKLASAFSFMMCILVILGSLAKQGYDILKDGLGEVYMVPTIVGMIAAGVMSFIAAKFMMKYIQTKKLYPFAIYVLVLGILVLFDQNMIHLIF